ncbi:3'-5' exonuclease [Streptomyces sp. ID05-04B]|uniref:3'-5' exonuclease n=1 Tax=Streptomyces sp. ID05-04B TaxID=3028661 RepID=UPI0029C48BDB|nr:3'-5' exonuclease [Streptomyces sp. ID05-04B]MDX5568451.1 3'-5' exonuclease [Streptomyces sp. ID05-04B]
MSWHLERLAGFDTESTGVNVEEDRIVTACVVQCGGGLPAAPGNWLADPGVPIPEAAAAVHGITTEKARAEGRSAGEVVEEVITTLTAIVLSGIPVVAMNAPFDFTLLDREARRHGVQPLTDIVGDDLRVIDPRVLDKQVDMFRRGKRTLTDLCAHYKVPLDGAHSADADAIAACRVAWRLGSQYPKLAELDLDGLHKAQTVWAAEQAASFQAHLRKKDPQAVIDGSWPLRPVGGAA